MTWSTSPCARGKIALRHYGNVPSERKADRSFVTRADREVEDFLRREATRRAPGLDVLGEESATPESTAEHLLVVDPIDGTGSFVDEVPTWSISVGLCRNGEPIRGVVHLPAVGETYAADENGLDWNGSRVVPPPSIR
jgi:fructose-1,6-bisphosphatase/inositol monophosphatase family enzyme